MAVPSSIDVTVTQHAALDGVEDWRLYLNSLVSSEISEITRYYDQVVQWEPRPNDSGALFELVDAPAKTKTSSLEELSHAIMTKGEGSRTAVLLNGNLNHDHDIERTLSALHGAVTRNSRIVVVAYNPYLRWLYHMANKLGIRQGEEPTTFVTETDLNALCKLSGFEIVRMRHVGYSPLRLKGLGTFLNSVLPALPVLRWMSLAAVIVLRPVKKEAKRPSLSIVIPARNERGNIENALKRMPEMGAPLEVIFVEGHSSDGTWEEIQRVCEEYKDRFTLKALRQTGKGKSDAVRLGFAHAQHDLVTILDADLTMPPELLTRFYEAYDKGLADFVNGSRLVYPMEGEAMKFLNRLGNVFFAKALSFVLGTHLGDSLCGTKLLLRRDYQRMIQWRKDFGDFDPFGDFELLFPAATLALGIVDIPIYYRARTYGTTNIRRFYHGLMLLRMTLIGLLKVRIGATSSQRVRAVD